jgi:hypothetical protein
MSDQTPNVKNEEVPSDEKETLYWVAKCSVKTCGTMTGRYCKKCTYHPYCSSKCEKEDFANHKKKCLEKLKTISKWKSDRVLDLEKDVFRAACETFLQKYVSLDEKNLGKCFFPDKIMDLDGTKCYSVKILDAKCPKDVLEDYKKNGFNEYHFFEIFTLNKDALFHSALALAMKEMAVMYDFKYEFDGDPVLFYGLANWNVLMDYTKLDLAFNASDYSTMTRLNIDQSKHKTLLFRTENFGEMMTDFTCSQYGLFQYHVSEADYPVMIVNSDSVKDGFKLEEKIFPSDIEESLLQMMKDNNAKLASGDSEQIGKIDLFAAALLSYKNQIISNVMGQTRLNQKKQLFPNDAQLVTAERAIELGVGIAKIND